MAGMWSVAGRKWREIGKWREYGSGKLTVTAAAYFFGR